MLPSHYTRDCSHDSPSRFLFSCFNPRPRTHTNITVRNAIIREMEEQGGLTCAGRSWTILHARLWSFSLFLFLFLFSALLQARCRTGGGQSIWWYIARCKDRELYIKRRIYRRGGIIIFAFPANDSSGNRVPSSETRVRFWYFTHRTERCSDFFYHFFFFN